MPKPLGCISPLSPVPPIDLDLYVKKSLLYYELENLGVFSFSGGSGTSGTSGTSGSSGTSGQNGISTGQIYYFNQSVLLLAPYRELSTIPLSTPQTGVTLTLLGSTNNNLISEFITPSLGFAVIPGGTQRFHLHFLKPASNDGIEVYVQIDLATSGGTSYGTLTANTNTALIGWVDAVTPIETLVDLVLPTVTINPTDRMIVRIYCNNIDATNHNISWYTEGTSYYSFVITSVGVVGGTSGTSGTSGTRGLFGGDSHYYIFSSTTVNNPVSNYLTLNDSTFSGSTIIRINHTNGDNVNITNWLLSLYPGRVRIFNLTDSSIFGIYDVTGISDNSPVTDVGINYVTGNGFFSNNDNIVISFAKQGISGNTDSFLFPSDLVVSLSNNKTFGRYTTGQIIPASGKTTAQVIQLAIAEPINPTVYISVSPSSINFNTTAITNTITYSGAINSLGATVSSGLLEWRRNNTGSYTALTSTTIISLSTYVHSLTIPQFDTGSFNYRFTITDSIGATTAATASATIAAYSAPTAPLTVTSTSGTTSPETNAKREKGKTVSTITGTVTRNTTNVPLQSYVLQRSVNGGAYSTIDGPISIGPGTTAITQKIDYEPTISAATSISYRLQVTDSYTTTTTAVSTVNFLNIIFYGSGTTSSPTSSDVRALPSRIFTDGSNPYNLNTGTISTSFTSAMPASLTITQVLDLDALNANITANYILTTMNVNDYAGTPTSYNVYTMTNASPYTDGNHRHQTTRA